MPQDAFHIRRSSEELNALLKGGKINRISQADKDEVTFIIYTGKSTVKLILSTNASNARVCLSLVEKDPAPVAPNFCMLLRKHLLGAEILSVTQYAFERIVEIKMHCVTDFSECERTLRCELMGKYSNLILTEGEVILGALKTTSLEENAHRVLLSGAKYAYPEPQDKLSPFDKEGLRERTENFLATHERGADEEETARFLFENVAGLALPTAREMVRQYTAKLPFWEYVGDFCEKEKNEPYLLTDNGKVDGKPLDFFAFPVANGVPMSSLNKAEDEFYTYKESKRAFEDKKRKLESAVRALKKKQQKKLQDTLERLKDCENMEISRVKGELITANLYKLEKGMKECVLENWYDPDGGSLKIAFDATLPPAQNAQRYFKAYAKYKRTREALEPRKREEEEEIEYTDSVGSALSTAESVIDLKEIETELIGMGLIKPQKERIGKKKEQITPFREYIFQGFKILSGRNNLQNDRLLKNCSGADIWLHAQKYHSTHVIIVTEGRQVSDEVLLFAAEICAYYSDGRSGGKVSVDYCERKNVKKPPKAKAGFVTYTQYKTLLVEPNRHSDNLTEGG